MRCAKLLSVAAVLVLASITAGCHHDDKQQLYEKISIGQSAPQVLQLLREPNGRSDKSWVYVEPFYLAIVSFENGSVAEKVRYTDHQVDYYARRYMD